MVKSICFTGHRHIAKEKLPAALAELRRVLETAIPQGFVDFYAGGALGWDTYCAQTVLDLREEYPCIALHLVLPCSRAEQTARWTEAQKAAYDCIYREADSCEFVSVDYTKDCMRLRNKRLVELADCCVCFCGEPEGRSGTGADRPHGTAKGHPGYQSGIVKYKSHVGVTWLFLRMERDAQFRAADFLFRRNSRWNSQRTSGPM